jgi:hypothetical protein
MAVFLIWISPPSPYLASPRALQLLTAMAQNESNNTSVGATPSTPSTTLTSQHPNSDATSGNPIFMEHDKPTHVKLVVTNGTHGLQASYSGRGVVKGINFSAIGAVLIVPRSEKGADLNGQANLTTTDGEKGAYNFHSIGHVVFAKGPIIGNITNILASGPISTNGTAIFHTNSSGQLMTINNLEVAFKEKIDILGRSTIVGWESK